MPTAPTDAELLNTARNALNMLLSGGAQAYSINGRSYSMMNLTELRKFIDELEAKIHRSTRGVFDLGGFGCR